MYYFCMLNVAVLYKENVDILYLHTIQRIENNRAAKIYNKMGLA